MILIRHIQAATAEHYGIPVGTMREPHSGREDGSNTWSIARPRQVAMCLALRLTEHSKTNIGRMFGGRDHTTVLHAVRRTERRQEAKEPMRQITKRLLQAEGRL